MLENGAKSLESEWVQELRDRIAKEFRAKVHISYDSAGHLALDLLIVPAAERGRGRGTAIMRILTAEADRRGIPMALSPTPEFGGNIRRLRAFYRRFGFSTNGGRVKDYTTSHAMIRPPVA